MAEQETSYDTMFGQMALEQGLCTNEELKSSIEKIDKALKTPGISPDRKKELLAAKAKLLEKSNEVGSGLKALNKIGVPLRCPNPP